MKFWYKSLAHYVNIDPEILQSTRDHKGRHCFIQVIDGDFYGAFYDDDIWVTESDGAKPRPATKNDLARYKAQQINQIAKERECIS
jgi:hypothetical protein